jgi:hypothetical protein
MLIKLNSSFCFRSEAGNGSHYHGIAQHQNALHGLASPSNQAVVGIAGNVCQHVAMVAHRKADASACFIRFYGLIPPDRELSGSDGWSKGSWQHFHRQINLR